MSYDAMLRTFQMTLVHYQKYRLKIAVDKCLNRDRRAVSSKIVSKYEQEIPQSQTADNPVAPRGRAAQPSRDTRKTN